MADLQCQCGCRKFTFTPAGWDGNGEDPYVYSCVACGARQTKGRTVETLTERQRGWLAACEAFAANVLPADAFLLQITKGVQ